MGSCKELAYGHQSSWGLIKALYMVINAGFGKMFCNLPKSPIGFT